MKNEKSKNNSFVKECLAQALVKLMKTKPISAISITELTKVAGVSRMTYYRNFNSKKEIISSYFDIMLSRYSDSEKYFVSSNGAYYDMEHMVHYFSWILEYKDFLYFTTTNKYEYLFLNAITNYILEKWHSDKNNSIEYYKLYAFSGALYSLYVAWAKDSFSTPPAEMALIFSNIYNHVT